MELISYPILSFSVLHGLYCKNEIENGNFNFFFYILSIVSPFTLLVICMKDEDVSQ